MCLEPGATNFICRGVRDSIMELSPGRSIFSRCFWCIYFKASLPWKASIHVEISFGKPNCIKSISIIFLRTLLSEVIAQHIVLFLGCDAWERHEDCFEKAGESIFSFLWEKNTKHTNTSITSTYKIHIIPTISKTSSLCKYLRWVSKMWWDEVNSLEKKPHNTALAKELPRRAFLWIFAREVWTNPRLSLPRSNGKFNFFP